MSCIHFEWKQNSQFATFFLYERNKMFVFFNGLFSKIASRKCIRFNRMKELNRAHIYIHFLKKKETTEKRKNLNKRRPGKKINENRSCSFRTVRTRKTGIKSMAIAAKTATSTKQNNNRSEGVTKQFGKLELEHRIIHQCYGIVNEMLRREQQKQKEKRENRKEARERGREKKTIKCVACK